MTFDGDMEVGVPLLRAEPVLLSCVLVVKQCTIAPYSGAWCSWPLNSSVPCAALDILA